MPEMSELSQSGSSSKKGFGQLLSWLLALLLLIVAGFSLYKYSGLKKQAAFLPKTPSATSQPQAASSSAIQNPSINPHNLSEKLTVTSTASGIIAAQVAVTNTSNQTVTDLSTGLYLNSPDVITSEPFLVNGKTVNQPETVGGPTFNYSEQNIPSIAPGETKTLSFSLPYTSHIAPGSYQLQSFMFDKLGNNFGGDSTTVQLKGTADLLSTDIGNCSVNVNGKTFKAGIGALITANQAAQAVCSITNPTKSSITAKVKEQYAVLHVEQYPFSPKREFDGPSITFAPGETKQVSIPLPTVTEPQVYESRITLFDINNQPLTPQLSFRWTLGGPSARIESATLDKNFYAPGNTITATIKGSPSMDIYWKDSAKVSFLTDPQVAVKVTSNGQLCGQATKKLPVIKSYTWDSQIVTITSSINCINPTLDAQIMEGNSVLADYSHTLISPQEAISNTPAPTNQNSAAAWLVVSIVAIVASIIIMFFIFRNNKKGSTGGPFVSSGTFVSILIAVFSVASVGALLIHPQTALGCGAQSAAIGNSAVDMTNSISFYETPTNCNNEGSGVQLWNSGSSVTNNGNGTATVNFYGAITSVQCGNVQGGIYLKIFINTTSGSSQWFYNGGTTMSSWLTGNQQASWAYIGDWGWNGGVSASLTMPIPSNTTSITIQAWGWTHHRDDGDYGWSQQYGNYNGSVTPQAPSSVSAAASCTSGNPSVNISWSQSLGASSYSVQRSDGTTITPGIASTSITDSSPARSTSYTYSVKACNSAGCSSPSSSGSVTTSACDNTAPSVSLSNPPTDTCYRGSTGTNGTPWSNTQPLQVRVDDTRGGTVPSSGISNVNIKVTNLSTNQLTRTINGTLSSGSATNGTYSVTIPADTTSFPTNGTRYSITAYATDNASNTSNSAAYSFTFDATGNSCQAPHIQTQNGDVHSQQNVGQ